MKLLKKTVLIGTTLLLGSFLLAACGNTNKEANNADKTHEVTDTLGNKVTVPAKPKRIIASYLEDYLVALGEKPVAQWTVGQGSIQDYLAKELKDVPTISYDLPYEAVLKFEPDLLLISSSALVEGGKYKEYSKIAPTYVVKNGENVTWRDQLEDIATVLDKKEQAKKVLEDYDTLTKGVQEDLGKKDAGKSAAVLWVTNNQVFMVSDNRSSGTVLYQDLGLQVPKLVEEISKNATADWNQVSLEKLAELDADHIFLLNSDESAPLFQEAIWKNLPAVKNNQVHTYDKKSSWLYNGPIANTQIVEDVKKALLN